MEAESQFFIRRISPCAPLKRPCSKTSDCCTGYCSVAEDRAGFCHDPFVLNQNEKQVSGAGILIRPGGGFSDLLEFASMKKSRGQQHPPTTPPPVTMAPDALASNLTPTSIIMTRVSVSGASKNKDSLVKDVGIKESRV